MEGKKQYDREFLMKLQQDPLSMTKPENLPNMDIIKDKAIAKTLVPGTNKLGDIFNPSFVKTTNICVGPQLSLGKLTWKNSIGNVHFICNRGKQFYLEPKYSI